MPLLQAADEKQSGSAAPQDRLPVVLLVDDDITTLRMLSGMLRQEGIATLNATTGPYMNQGMRKTAGSVPGKRPAGLPG